MGDASERGNDWDQEEVSVVFVEGSTHSTLMAIARSVPRVWPTGLSSGREEFSSICIAGLDFEHSLVVQRTTITLRLSDQVMWRAARPYKMEMCVRKYGR